MWNRSGVLVLLVVVFALPPIAYAHTIERNTSFLRLDAAADAVLAVEVKRSYDLASGASLSVLEVFRAPKDANIAKGTTLETADRVRGIESGSYGSGVSFAFLKRIKGQWYTIVGTYLSSTVPLAIYEKDRSLNFLGSLVTHEQVRSAMAAHGALVPALATDETQPGTIQIGRAHV